MVYFSKIKLSNNKNYIVVTDRPSISENLIEGFLVGTKNQNLKYGVLFDIELINQNFKINDSISGYYFTDELIEGKDNLYKIIKK